MNTSKYSTADRELFQEVQSRSDFVIVMETLLYILVLVTGILGNTAVIWIIYKKRNLKNTSYFLIGSLAFSDVFLFLGPGWQLVAAIAKGKLVLGYHLCQFQGYSVLSLACCSLLIMSLMALNRYIKVVRPNQYQHVFSIFHTKILIVLSWILGYLELLPYILSSKEYIFHPGKLFCFQEKTFSITTLLPFIYISIPLFVISTCYFLIFKKLREHQNSLKRIKKGGKAPLGASVEDIKTTRTLFITVVGFMACWIPISVIDVTDFIRGDTSMPRQVYLLYTFLGCCSSVINPIIYGVMNRGFRREYLELLRSRKKIRQVAAHSFIRKGRVPHT